jgi:LacI family transcriptional regulator
MMICKKCQSTESFVKSGILRGQQRYQCKNCGSHFTQNENIGTKNQKSHQTTIIDVAKVLGVAPSTVSRALNQKTEINSSTRELILKTAKEMDYRPNLLAQSLNSGETHTIGVIIPNIERPYFAGILAGIQSIASNAGYRVIICQSNETHQTEVLNVQALLASRVDGLLISHSKETNAFDHLRLPLNKGLPIVHFDRVAYDLDTPKIVLEDYEGSYKLVEHLIQQGCKRIGVVSGPKNLMICQKRLEGFRAAMAKYNIEVQENLIAHTTFGKNETINIMENWLQLPEPPDGIYAVFYHNAIEMMAYAKQKKIKIPEQIAFVGFGDEPMAELIEPSLTVFQLYPHKIGEIAASVLIENIINKDQAHSSTLVMEGTVIIRESSLKNVAI